MLQCDVFSLVLQIPSWNYVSETVTLHENTSLLIIGKRQKTGTQRSSKQLLYLCFAGFSGEMYKIPLRKAIWDKVHSFAGY